jgi:ApbE superfamily uncharacterized protein (UPF0280 family)
MNNNFSSDPYSDRVYRVLHSARDLVYFRVSAEETDLHIGARRFLQKEAHIAALQARAEIKAEIARRPRFAISFEPLKIHGTETELVASMLKAGITASVGPMAAVAGAIAEYVGRALLKLSDEVIVENGGDIFLRSEKERLVAVHAGESPLSGKLAVAVKPADGLGVCTSSGTVGHSISFGKADAALIIAKDCALADAAASHLGNLVRSADDIDAALDDTLKIDGVNGALIIIGDRVGVKGCVELRVIQ